MEDSLRRILADRTVRRCHDPKRRLSAVMLPLFWKHSEYYLLLTKRTELVQEHKGQISFPGGVYEERDSSLLNTALRECAEEIGLGADSVRVLGRLDDIITQTSSYIVSPFVAVIPWPYEFRVNSREIDEIIEVPVLALMDDSCVREERVIIGGEAVVNYFYHYQGRVVWGATARMLRQFLGIFALAMK